MIPCECTRMDIQRASMLVVSILTTILTLIDCSLANTDPRVYNFKSCSKLLIGQYVCAEPEIDPKTQQAVGCTPDRNVTVNCMPAPNITCGGVTYNGSQVAFNRTIPCRWTNGHSFETTLLLSIFLGMFGIDRFYLGYPAIGLLKFSTLGFFFLGQLVDIILIATQVVTPADHSDYVIDYFGAGLSRISQDNATFFYHNTT